MSLQSSIRVRVAPSPTGYLHLGTARTALFNYLFAKKHQGKLFLRIEDTDKKRSREIYTQDILDGLHWLGIQWTGKPIFQTDRLKIYQKYIHQLIKDKLAYQADGAFWLDVKSAAAGLDRVEFTDLVRGKISFPVRRIKDFVIVTSNKLPLFLLTNVIDDFEMKISHVIRGEDHISNTPRQILIQRALRLPLPKYAHIPLILAPDKSKMSKRAGAVSILEYRKLGILPEALVNFLGLLGFHPANDREFYRLDELAKVFSLRRIQHAGAVFDRQKLFHLNSHYLRLLDQAKLERLLREYSRYKLPQDKFRRFVAITRNRLASLAEFDAATAFLRQLPNYPAERLIFKKSTKSDTLVALQEVYRVFSGLSDWREVVLRQALEKVVQQKNLSNGDVFWSARVALSGLLHSPQPSEIAWALGKKEGLRRLKIALNKLRQA